MRPWQSRGGTADSYRLPLKWYTPIASVAALSERLVHLQIMQRKFIGMRLPSLSLRGPEGAVAISQYPAGSQESHGENVTGCERLPRPLRGLAMTRQGGAAVHQSPHAVKLPPTRRSLSAATDAIGLYGFIGSLYELQLPARDCHVGCASSQ